MPLTGDLAAKTIAPVPVEEETKIRSRLVRDPGRIATVEVVPDLKFDLCRK